MSMYEHRLEELLTTLGIAVKNLRTTDMEEGVKLIKDWYLDDFREGKEDYEPEAELIGTTEHGGEE